MDTIYTIEKDGTISKPLQIELCRKLHDLHPEATHRLTFFSSREHEYDLKELLELADVTTGDDEVLQLVSRTGRVQGAQGVETKAFPDYYYFAIDLKSKDSKTQ